MDQTEMTARRETVPGDEGGVLGGWLPYLMVTVVALLAHGLALGADWYMDDFLKIVREPALTEGRWDRVPWRWIPYGLYSVSYQLAGFSSPAFHVWNVLVHVALACLMIPLTGAFLRSARWFEGDRGAAGFAAVAAALLFACHPFGSEAVNYGRCTMIQLVALFSTAAAWCTLEFLQKRDLRWAAGAAAAAIAAACSKQPGIFHATMVVTIVLVAAGSWRQIAGVLPGTRQRLWALAGLVCVVGLSWPVINWWWKRALSQVLRADFFDHFLTQGRVFWGYLVRVVWPTALSSDHVVLQTTSTADTMALVATGSVLLVSASFAVLVFVPRWRFVGALGCLALSHLLVRFLYVNREFFVEYRVYPSLPWFALAAGVGIAFVYQHRRKAAIYLTALLVVTGVSLSARRSAEWQDSTVLAKNVLERYPDNNRARCIVMKNAYESGEYREVVEGYNTLVGSLAEIKRHNRDVKDRGGRLYPEPRILQDYLTGEELVTYALAEIKGAKFAIAYAESVMRHVEERHPGAFALDDGDKRPVGVGLRDAHSILQKHAATLQGGTANPSDDEK